MTGHSHEPRHQTRMTQQRAVILEELRKLKTHPTADELYQIVRGRLPRISLGTVYRNLVHLTGSGQAIRLDGGGGAHRFDGDTRPHSHVRCVSCGRVADVPDAEADRGTPAVSVPGFAKILGSRVEYDGLCDACGRAESERDQAVIYHPAD